MKLPLFFDEQNVLDPDLASITEAIERETTERVIGLTTQQGVSSGLAVSSIGGNTLQVAAGYGYTKEGQRIEFTSAPTKAITAPDVGKYLVARQTTVNGTPVTHPWDGSFHDTRRDDVYSLEIVVASADNEIVLCQIIAINSPTPGDVSFDESVKEYLSARIADGVITDAMLDPTSTTYLHQFVYGTGTDPSGVNPHRLHVNDISGGAALASLVPHHQNIMHDNGVVGDFTTLTPGISGSDLILSTIAAGSYLYVQGVELTALPDYDYTFPLTGIAALFLVGIKSDGTFHVFERLRFTTRNSQEIWIWGVSQDVATGAGKSLLIDANASPKTASWQGGPAVQIQDNGGIYRLPGKSGNGFIDIKVTGVLPVSGLITDTITVYSLSDAEFGDKAPICSVNQEEVGTLVLDAIRDLRAKGTLGWRELSSTVFDFDRVLPTQKSPQFGMVDEIAPNVVVAGFYPTITAATQITVSSGTFWIKGKRSTINTQIVTGGAPTTTYYVYVDGRTNQVLISTSDPRNYTYSGFTLLIAEAVTDGGGTFTVVRDMRNFAEIPAIMSSADGRVLNTPRFENGLTVIAGVVTIPSGVNSLAGRIVYNENIGFEIVTGYDAGPGLGNIGLLTVTGENIKNNSIDPSTKLIGGGGGTFALIAHTHTGAGDSPNLGQSGLANDSVGSGELKTGDYSINFSVTGNDTQTDVNLNRSLAFFPSVKQSGPGTGATQWACYRGDVAASYTGQFAFYRLAPSATTVYMFCQYVTSSDNPCIFVNWVDVDGSLDAVACWEDLPEDPTVPLVVHLDSSGVPVPGYSWSYALFISVDQLQTLVSANPGSQSLVDAKVEAEASRLGVADVHDLADVASVPEGSQKRTLLLWGLRELAAFMSSSDSAVIKEYFKIVADALVLL